MRTSGRRATGVLAAAACVGTFAAATPAQAGLLGNLGGLVGGVLQPTTPKAPTTTTTGATTPTTVTGVAGGVATTSGSTTPTANPLGPILGLLGGQNGVGTVVQGLLCQPLTAVSGVVRNPVTGGLSPITDGLTTLACNASILDYRFQTRFKRADGTIVTRTQVAQLGVPTALNVDDDAQTDLIGTITLVGQNAVGLKVERASGETSQLPVQVEAIVGDPSATVLGGRRINVGYDSRDDRAPSSFTISTPADTLLKPGPSVTATVTQTGRGERVAILAGVFDGTPDARTNATQARLDYRQAPDAATFTANLSGATAVTATTNRPGGLLTAAVTTPDLSADVALRAVPAKLDLAFQQDAGRIAYDGNGSSIGRLTADLRSKKPLIGDADRVRADLLGMPVKGSLGLRAPETSRDAFGLTADGEIDRIEVQATGGTADFPAVPGADDDAGAFLDTTGGTFRLAARVFKLRSVSVAPDPAAIEIRTGAVHPFRVDATVPGEGSGAAPSHLALTIQDLPESLKLGVQDGQDGARLTYEASAPIDRIDVAADGLALVDGADRVKLSLDGISGNGALALRTPTSGDGRLGLVADGVKIDRIDVAATKGDRPFPEVPGDGADAGAFVDTTDGLRLAARIYALESITVGTDPVSLSLRTGVVRPFLVDATVPGKSSGAAPVHVTAAIRDLPKALTIGLEDGPDGTRLRYAADSPIDTIDVAGSGIPLVDGADRLHVRLTGVSGDGSIAVSGGDDDGALGLKADGVAVQKLEIEATDAGSDFPQVPGSGDDAGAFLDTTGGHFRLAARVFELRSITVDPDPVTLEATTGVSKPFRVDATLPPGDGATTPIHVTADIEDLPTSFRLALQDDGAGGTKLAYDANARVERLSLGADGVPLLDGADSISAAIRDVPKSFALGLPKQDGPTARPLAELSIGDGEAAIGELRLAAGSTPLPVTGLNEDGSNDDAVEDLFQYESGSADQVGVAVRLTGLKSLSLGLDPIAITLGQDETRSKPIRLQASTPNDSGPASQITGRFSKTSASTSVQALLADGQPTRLVFGNAANLARLELNATNLGSIPKLDLALDNVPRTLNVCVDSAGGCRRDNPNLLSGGGAAGKNRPYVAKTSIDLDDAGTLAAGQFTTLNASLPVGSDNVSVSNLRFRNLQLDLGDGPTFSYLTQSVPRLYAFFDSRNQPFSIGEIKFPPTIESFKIGTPASPATANNRIVWLKGTKGLFGAQLDNVSAGQLVCGGAREMTIKIIGLNINLLKFLGTNTQILPVCSS